MIILPVGVTAFSIYIGRYLVESSHAWYKDEPCKRFLNGNKGSVSEGSAFDMNPVGFTDLVDNQQPSEVSAWGR